MRCEIAGVYDRIVMNDDHTVVGGVDIELDRVGAQLDRPQERRNGVFGQGLVRSPMGDSFRGASLRGRVQAFPRVVALGTMSAKL
jgi:hypothetical protein